MLGHTDAVAEGNLGNGNPVLYGSLQIDVIRADSRSDGEFQLRRFSDPLGGQVGGPEGLRDDDVGIGQFAFETRTFSFLIRSNNEGMTEVF
jgi:hypothetical protein